MFLEEIPIRCTRKTKVGYTIQITIRLLNFRCHNEWPVTSMRAITVTLIKRKKKYFESRKPTVTNPSCDKKQQKKKYILIRIYQKQIKKNLTSTHLSNNSRRIRNFIFVQNKRVIFFFPLSRKKAKWFRNSSKKKRKKNNLITHCVLSRSKKSRFLTSVYAMVHKLRVNHLIKRNFLVNLF